MSCSGAVELGILLPHLAGVIVEEVVVAAGLLLVLARPKAAAAACPACGTASGRVHSRYERRLADAALGGRQVEIRLAVRRFFCPGRDCERRTFAEQVNGLTTRYARKTPLLAGVLGRIAVALAGRAGSRLAGGLGAPASRQVMIRQVMALPDPAASALRVVGVDDFAIRRGQNYGTLLIDCETGAPLDLIEGRDAQPLADWLAAHPGVEIICRDRASAYADGARTGAPDAIQVADRFHLWQNLAKAVGKCVAAHRTCLAEPAAEATEEPPPTEPAAETEPGPEPSGKFAERAKRNHALVHGLRAEGRGIREIARHLGWGHHTVQRYDRAATWQELVDGRWSAPRPSKLDPFKPYLDQHADGAHGSITRLFGEIKKMGYDGSYPTVRDYLSGRQPARKPLPEAPPTVRDVTNWLCRRPDTLTEDEKPKLKAILDRCPELRAASDQVRGFARMMEELTGEDLPQWMADARAAGLPGISSFAKGLEQDLDAVTNGLTMHWSSGPVEGRVNYIKMVKRQMFGRASLPLLRKRVLLTAQK
ncbi:MAG: ISL3 family transposase [Actinobacteria bacterium]|nr:ISL3 family transposase [Actinomycetota bacterium]